MDNFLNMVVKVVSWFLVVIFLAVQNLYFGIQNYLVGSFVATTLGLVCGFMSTPK